MKTVGMFEAKTHFSALIEAVQRGETVTITKHGKPVAKIVGHADERAGLGSVVERLKANQEKLSLGDLDWRALRDEGRR